MLKLIWFLFCAQLKFLFTKKSTSNMQMYQDYTKVKCIIESCETVEHVEIAQKVFSRYCKQHLTNRKSQAQRRIGEALRDAMTRKKLELNIITHKPPGDE